MIGPVGLTAARTRPTGEWNARSSICGSRSGSAPQQLAARVGVPASTVHAVLVRQGLSRLRDLDLATGAKVRGQAKNSRYERPEPGSLLHVDIKKLAVVPPGGGWRVHGEHAMRDRAPRCRDANAAAAKSRGSGQAGYCYVHCAVDDHSRVAYVEVHDDETGATAANFLRNAVDSFASLGVSVQEVMTDNGPCYRSNDFAKALAWRGITHRRTRPYRPQTNGKSNGSTAP